MPLLERGVGTVWTEHSERATLSAGISEEIRKQLGRWTPTADQAYERTARKNVLRAQQAIAGFVKASLGRQDPFDEALVKAAVVAKMEELEMPDRAIQIQREKLDCFGKMPAPKRLKLTEAGAVEDEAGRWPVEQRCPLVKEEAIEGAACCKQEFLRWARAEG